METSSQVVLVRGEEELFARTAHLFATATDTACAANDMFTWVAARSSMTDRSSVTDGSSVPERPRPDPVAEVAEWTSARRRIRKLYRPGVLLDPTTAQHLSGVRGAGAQIRITPDEINETIILDRRVVILAGDRFAGRRGYSVITQPEVVQGVLSLFEAAWRSATDLETYDAQIAELRSLAPRVLDLLGSGCKDETAARTLGLGVRTYRRRVAELMAALGAESRFQAGLRARELGLV